MKWYVIHTKVRQEFRALENFQSQSFEVFLPTCQVKKQQVKIRLVTEPLFPRYLFIRLSDITNSWFPIRSTRGVSWLLKLATSADLVEISETIVNCFRQRCTK